MEKFEDIEHAINNKKWKLLKNHKHLIAYHDRIRIIINIYLCVSALL